MTLTDENGNEIPLKKRVDFDDGSFIEEIREGNEIRRVALNIKPHNHKPPKVNDSNDEPIDFFNF